MSERMTDERLADVEHQSSFENDCDAYDLCEELLQALKAERAIVDKMPCYFQWFWNEVGYGVESCGKCPSCLTKEKPPASEGDLL